jgi:hypothetical protein
MWALYEARTVIGTKPREVLLSECGILPEAGPGRTPINPAYQNLLTLFESLMFFLSLCPTWPTNVNGFIIRRPILRINAPKLSEQSSPSPPDLELPFPGSYVRRD